MYSPLLERSQRRFFSQPGCIGVAVRPPSLKRRVVHTAHDRVKYNYGCSSSSSSNAVKEPSDKVDAPRVTIHCALAPWTLFSELGSDVLDRSGNTHSQYAWDMCRTESKRILSSVDYSKAHCKYLTVATNKESENDQVTTIRMRCLRSADYRKDH